MNVLEDVVANINDNGTKGLHGGGGGGLLASGNRGGYVKRAGTKTIVFIGVAVL